MLSQDEVEQIALETGFIKRKRKVSALEFVESLLFTNFNHSALSLETIAESLTETTGVKISKQAVDNRFTANAVTFFTKLLEKALREINPQSQCYDLLRHFNEVRIKDSTSFQIPDSMREKYPGSGGASSKACIRIQFEYDLKTGKVLDLSLHPFKEQDTTNAQKSIPDISEGSLIIRDLGYTSIAAIQGIKKHGAYYVSRLINGSNVFELDGGKYVKLDLENLYKQMNRLQIGSIEKTVYVTDNHEPVRLIVELLPAEIVEERVRRAKKEAKKKGRQVSEEYKSRARFNFFMTNVPEEKLTMHQVHQAYGLRWQIELVFKVWKSIGEIHKIKAMKLERFECYLFAKLLWILMNWLIVWEINRRLTQTSDKLLSFYKAYKSLRGKIERFHIAFKSSVNDLAGFIDSQIALSDDFQILSKKKNRNSLYAFVELV